LDVVFSLFVGISLAGTGYINKLELKKMLKRIASNPYLLQ